MFPRIVHKGITYKTKSNQRKLVKVGDKIEARKVKKIMKKRKCKKCFSNLHGFKRLSAPEFMRQSKSKKSVARPFGDRFCGKCVQKMVITSYLKSQESLFEARK